MSKNLLNCLSYSMASRRCASMNSCWSSTRRTTLVDGSSCFIPKRIYSSTGGEQNNTFDIKLQTPPIIATKTQSSNATSFTYRCSIDDPTRHDVEHLHKFYKLDEKELTIIDPFKENLRRDHYAQCKAFTETCLMIREPAIEIINYLRKVDLSQPAYRFILYGQQDGTGKRSTLLHLIHHCYRNKWLIVNIPNCSSVLRKEKENQASTYKENRIDTPIEALLFLRRFAKQNASLLKELNLKTTKSYNWSSKDKTDEGTPLLSLFELAENRIKCSSDICGALIREIKLQAMDKKFKVFVAIDQVNSYFGPTRLHRADKTSIEVDDLTIARNFKKLLKNDWNNAVVVGTINSQGVIIPGPFRHKKFYDTSIQWAQRRRKECSLHYEGPLTPAQLLKREGFYYLEPFIPIEVPVYSNKEIFNHYEYYKDRNWIQNVNIKTDDGREELVFLSGKNPAEFARVCQTL